MLNAGVLNDIVLQDLENNYAMIDKLNKNNADKIKRGELNKLINNPNDYTYTHQEIRP